VNVFIAAMQLVVAAAFVSIPAVRARFGSLATVLAHRELERQGVSPNVLVDNGMRFDAGGHETVLPVTVASVMTVLAVLNFAGSSWATPLTWVFQSIVLVGNGVILYSQLTATTSVQAAFARKGDPVLARIDVPALLGAARDGFPSWVWTLQNVRHVAVFGASILALAATAIG
jgi:hypothetical protein